MTTRHSRLTVAPGPRILLLLVALLAPPACDDEGATTDTGTAADKGQDSRGDQGPSKDQAGGEAAAPDLTRTDQASLPDGPVTQLDGPLTQQDGLVTKADQGSGACSSVQCALQNDCCYCRAYDKSSSTPLTCSITGCKQATCGASLIKQPVTYCLTQNGRCYVTDGATSCTSDADCHGVNNCCDCLALPLGAMAPPCSIVSCIPTCMVHGIFLAKPRCLGGLCKLGF